MNGRAAILVWWAAALIISAASPADGADMSTATMAMHGGAGAAVSFADLKATVEALTRARLSTEKYRDVGVAKSDGYRPFGPYVRGMGFHYVNPRVARGDFNIERPPILLYEKDESAPEGLRLVGVSYLLAAPAGPNDQPVKAPFPQALAVWHKHQELCLFADRSVRLNANAADCQQQGGRFIAETDWMVHAWIWKDNPAGVFNAINPEVQ